MARKLCAPTPTTFVPAASNSFFCNIAIDVPYALSSCSIQILSSPGFFPSRGAISSNVPVTEVSAK